jgi:2-polyprenyl-3-methyl-5-hydroxy-6-metoxy-1,4-benzoquinol methylase
MVTRRSDEDWTFECISNFWNWQNSRLNGLENSFSYQVGGGIINVLKTTGHLEGCALDYGCGPGYLLNHLLRERLDCYGIDLSKEAIDLTNAKYDGNTHWRGGHKVDNLPTPFKSDFFDVITCIETLEHLTRSQLTAATCEIFRILKPNGIAMFTTPYAENLDKAMLYCPFCDSEFHRMQHFRSFNEHSLEAVLTATGFAVLFCQNLNFMNFQNNRRLCKQSRELILRSYARDSYNRLKNGMNGFFDAIGKTKFPFKREIVKQSGKGPHLCAIVTKCL